MLIALVGVLLAGCASNPPAEPTVPTGSLAGVYAPERVAMRQGSEQVRNDAGLSPSGPVVPLGSQEWLFPVPPAERPVRFRRFEQD